MPDSVLHSHDEVVELLGETLDEETETKARLTELAEDMIVPAAPAGN